MGHGYTAESLQAEQSNGLEAALWTALRALEENAALRRRMADRASRSRFKSIADNYLKQAQEAEARAAVVRKVLVSEPADAKKIKGSHPKPGTNARPGHPRGGNNRAAKGRKSHLPT